VIAWALPFTIVGRINMFFLLNTGVSFYVSFSSRVQQLASEM